MPVPDLSALAAKVLWAAFLLSFAFGAIAQRTQFCTMGAVSDAVTMGDYTRLRQWALAAGVAMLGFWALALSGQVDPSKTLYSSSRWIWLSALVGGSMFGFGMVLASGCGSKTLVRVGAGNLKSLVVFVFLGIAAYMTLKGLFAIWRTAWFDPVAVDLGRRADLPTLLASWTGMAPRTAVIVAALGVGGALLAFVFKDREFRGSFDHILGGVVVGLVIVGGWYVTGHVGFGENPETLEDTFFGTNSRTIESLSFTAPVGYSLELLMLWSDKSLTVTFGIAAAIGIILGSAAYAVASRTFRWEGFAGAEDTGMHVLGGLLMGFGGVTALGCTIGQGLSGLSTLALGSFLAFGGIVAGSALTMKWQYWRIMRAA